MTTGARHETTAWGATVAGLLDRVWHRGGDIDVHDVASLQGKTVLVTGASRGLGRAAALQLASLGARLILPCRSLGPETAAAITSETGADVTVLPVDLASVDSVDALADHLVSQDIQLQVAVFNAGVVPRASRQTLDGLDIMFHVNFMANVQLATRLVEDERLQPGSDGAPARAIFVGSEAHRASPSLDLDTLGQPSDYGTRDVLAHYGTSKRLLHTWVYELHRRTQQKNTPIGVHHMCPGAVASDIAREAPPILGALLRPVMRLAFQSPAAAARPLVWLAAHDGLPVDEITYLHMTSKKRPDPETEDSATSARLWDEAAALLQTLRTARGSS